MYLQAEIDYNYPQNQNSRWKLFTQLIEINHWWKMWPEESIWLKICVFMKGGNIGFCFFYQNREYRILSFYCSRENWIISFYHSMENWIISFYHSMEYRILSFYRSREYRILSFYHIREYQSLYFYHSSENWILRQIQNTNHTYNTQKIFCVQMFSLGYWHL